MGTVKWTKDESSFLDRMSKEGEAWLFQWHAAEIRDLASGADSETLVFIEEHYRRTGLDFRPAQTIHKYLFANNTPVQLFGWAKQLRIFRVCRSPGGHLDTVPDAFSARATFRDEPSRSQFLSSLGIVFDRDHPVELRGHKVRLHMASRNGWHDIWFNVTSGNSSDYSLTEEDFKIARELDAFFRTLTVKFIEPCDNRNCICPKFFPEAFSAPSKP